MHAFQGRQVRLRLDGIYSLQPDLVAGMFEQLTKKPLDRPGLILLAIMQGHERGNVGGLQSVGESDAKGALFGRRIIGKDESRRVGGARDCEEEAQDEKAKQMASFL